MRLTSRAWKILSSACLLASLAAVFWGATAPTWNGRTIAAISIGVFGVLGAAEFWIRSQNGFR
jgi:hypothetical protein